MHKPTKTYGTQNESTWECCMVGNLPTTGACGVVTSDNNFHLFWQTNFHLYRQNKPEEDNIYHLRSHSWAQPVMLRILLQTSAQLRSYWHDHSFTSPVWIHATMQSMSYACTCCNSHTCIHSVTHTSKYTYIVLTQHAEFGIVTPRTTSLSCALATCDSLVAWFMCTSLTHHVHVQNRNKQKEPKTGLAVVTGNLLHNRV